MRPAIIVFAKAPVPGRVKTRLIGPLSPGQATELHRSFVRDTLERLMTFLSRTDLELHTDSQLDEWKDLPVSCFPQVAGDLGARLLHALQKGLAAGRTQVAVVGSDTPTLPVSHLERLLNSSADVALGPCEDGGYYAIVCRETHAAMFAGVHWSASSTLVETVEACRACGLTVELGEPWFDIDTLADLERLARQQQAPRHTRGWLEQNARYLFGEQPGRKMYL